MEKRGLGRGLAALISDTMTDSGDSQVRELPVSQITANPHQPRTLFDPLKMEELVTSVKEHGILQPVLVRRIGHERYQLVAGERRFRAAQKAGLAAIPALVRECTEREQLEMAVVENVQREDIGPIESARAYRRLIDEFDMTQETVAQRVGKSRSSIANTLRLLTLPEEVQDSVERGEITEGHARALMLDADVSTILHVWQSVVKRQLSVREAEKLAKEMREKTRSAGETGLPPVASPDALARSRPAENGRTGGDPNEADITDRLRQALGTKVSLRRTSGGAGRIEIEFYSTQELERIVDLLMPGRLP